MKKLVMALSLTLVYSLAIAEPEGGHEGEKKGDPFARVQRELGLTDEQLEEMRKISEAGGSRKEMRAVLTPEQQAKAAEARKARKGKKEGRLARMKNHLDLSDEQVEKIQKIMEEGGSREDIHAVLTPEQQAKREQARENHKEQRQPPAESVPAS